jgi:PAS domain S-box-containing protein
MLAALLAIVLRELRRREAADARLRQSEERYALAMAGSQEGHWDWDVMGGKVYLSARLLQLLGRHGEDLFADERWFERQGLLDEEQAERRRRALREHLLGRSGQYECEYRIVRGGEVRWLLDRGIASRDAFGRVRRMSGAVIDITERKLGEERLREQAALLELAHDALIVRDDKNAITAWNQGAEQTYGWSRDEACGNVSHELLRTRFPVPVDEIERELAHTGHWQGELIHHRKDGTQVIVDSRWTVQRDEHGRIVRRLETDNDITERKLALTEQAHLEQRLREAEKLEALGTLAGGIAHDFNNILGAILGYGDMAHRAAPEGSALRRHAGNVLAAAQRAKALVDQILDYSRSQRVPRNPVDVRTVVDETLDLLRASLSPDIRLEVGNDTQPLVVICDPTHVHQIVMNLCTNAVQAMPAGGTLRVMRARQDVPMGRALSHGALLAGPYVLLTVSDSGTGMSAELLKRAFEPFFTTKDPGAGTGLGLALVQNIVTELGGAIDVQSTPGQGSTFCIYLPRFDTPAVEAPNGSVLKSGSGQRVMVVEDERGLLLLAEEILASLGYEPAGFPNAREAIDALAADPSQFDAALIDYVLPGMTGVELTRRLREHRADLPVILLSGYRGPMLEQEAKTAGIAQLLAKPITTAGLAQALAAIVA